MTITVKLDDQLYAKRMTLTELAERVDITLANLSILKTGKAKAIRFSTLDAICRELESQPGDILGFEASESPAFPNVPYPRPGFPSLGPGRTPAGGAPLIIN